MAAIEEGLAQARRGEWVEVVALLSHEVDADPVSRSLATYLAALP